MRRALSSPVCTALGFTVAFIGIVAVLYNQVAPFVVFREAFGSLLSWAGPGGLFGLAGFLGGMAVASLSCRLDAGRRARMPIHRLDYFFVLVAWVCAGSLLAGFLEKGRGIVAWHLICLALWAAGGCYVWATTLVRQQAGTLGETMLWRRVFRTLRLNQFSGVFILAVVVIGSIVLLVGAWTAVARAASYSVWNDIRLATWVVDWFVSVGLPALTLGAVATLSLNILSITAAKEHAVEERLRQERSRAELITNVTHDLRTPLTSIVSYADLIGKLELDAPELTEYADVLGRKAGRLKQLIGDLLEASRASAGDLPVQLAPIELTEILAQAAGDFDAALNARKLTWVGPVPRPAFVQADGEHLWRILENLLGNVIKYAKPGTCVHADLIRAPGVIQLRLSNLTAEPLAVSADQLIGQFVRGDAARRSEGSGLGLFIADQLARLMGARLSVTAEGDHFAATVELPALDHGIPAAADPGDWPLLQVTPGPIPGGELARARPAAREGQADWLRPADSGR